MPTRRSFMKDAALLGAASVGASALTASSSAMAATVNHSSALDALPPLDVPDAPPEEVARDEAFWKRVAARYKVTSGVTNMEAGSSGMMALPVLEAYHRNIDRANRDSSYFARREFPAIQQSVRAKVAAFAGAKPTEIMFSRNATEALQALISQYNKVGPGDTIMYADLDYNAMQWSMNELAFHAKARSSSRSRSPNWRRTTIFSRRTPKRWMRIPRPSCCCSRTATTRRDCCSR